MGQTDFLTGSYRVVQGDVIDWLRSLPDDSVDLIFSSPPYELARLYLENGKDLGIARKTEDWVKWMVDVSHEARRVCKGLVAWVVEGQTRKFRYSCSPALLQADLCRAGFAMRKPPIYHRVGIPGSGGPDWLRNDYEPIICFTKSGKLVWSDNTALGHAPKWAPGGEMAHRLANGARVNQWGPVSNQGAGRQPNGEHKTGGARPSHKFMTMTSRGANGERKIAGGRKTLEEKLALGAKPHTKRDAGEQPNGEAMREQAYLPPVLANPGNKIDRTYTTAEVEEIVGEMHDVITCKVGGGLMGSDIAHENEAPFPESLSDFFVLSFCPPGGVVLDPFCGSGTTLASALKHGRRAVGCDLRASQVKLTERRIMSVQPQLMEAP